MTPAAARPGSALLPRRALLAAGAAAPMVGAGLTACSGSGSGDGTGEELRAEAPRQEPDAPEGSGELAVPFAARLLAAADPEAVNLVCSPLSAQVALVMAGLGAAGDTRAQIEQVLGGSMEELAQAANTFSQVLAAVGEEQAEDPEEGEPGPARAALVNGAWLQEGFEVSEAYLEDLAAALGSGVHQADFEDDSSREQAREDINAWVAEQTQELIEELIAEGTLTAQTRLVLVDALHLQASWKMPLTEADGPFTTAAGQEVTAPMLAGTAEGWYEDDLCRAASLPASGDEIALALIQPVADVATVLEGWSSAADDADAGLGALLAGLGGSDEPVALTMPRVDIGWSSSLVEPLQQIGIVDAFGDDADFSQIAQQDDLALSDVLQKAVITIDEDGMEAAAATAAVVGVVSAPQIEQELHLDAPYLYVAYETSTLAPLVLGWIGDPTQTGEAAAD